MEYRDDLEHLLLDGLPDDERRLTLDSMNNATAAKLAKLKNRHEQSSAAGQPRTEDAFDYASD